MRTLNEEIARIKSEVADIASKTFSGKSVQQKVNQHFAEIIWQEHETAEKVWDELYQINDQIAAVEKIICQPIKKA